MPIFDLYSKRKKLNNNQNLDVYQYAFIPENLKVQIVHIIRDALGSKSVTRQGGGDYYQTVHDILCREYGQFQLVENARSHEQAVINFILTEPDIDKQLDCIELIFRIMENIADGNENARLSYDSKMTATQAIDELNQRFKENSVGYNFQSGIIIKVDSEIIHSEVVKPVLILLTGKIFKGANDEFLKAHEYYRANKYKECLVELLKSFESTMKAILKKYKIEYGPTDTAKALINLMYTNNIVPQYLDSYTGGLRSILESGTATLRNKNGAHGQGSEIVEVPESIAKFALHLTAATLLFIIENCKK